MTVNKQHFLLLKSLTEERFGQTLNTPTDFNRLSIRIAEVTGESISLSTLKRFWGYVPSPHTPSVTVLSILARYNGFSDWNSFEQKIDNPEANVTVTVDSDFLTTGQILSSSVGIGDIIIVEWEPDKGCTLQCIAAGRYRIIQSRNIKLQVDDTISAAIFCIGLPFFATDIIRKGKTIPAYTGARSCGVKSIKLIPA